MMVRTVSFFCCLLVLCAVMVVQCDQPSEPNFLSSLVSRVRETEPQEIREYRTSCIREPGCSWKCLEDARCHCVCGSEKRRKTKKATKKPKAA